MAAGCERLREAAIVLGCSAIAFEDFFEVSSTRLGARECLGQSQLRQHTVGCETSQVMHHVDESPSLCPHPSLTCFNYRTSLVPNFRFSRYL